MDYNQVRGEVPDIYKNQTLHLLGTLNLATLWRFVISLTFLSCSLGNWLGKVHHIQSISNNSPTVVLLRSTVYTKCIYKPRGSAPSQSGPEKTKPRVDDPRNSCSVQTARGEPGPASTFKTIVQTKLYPST